jgi:hypothetical protein
MHKKVLYILGGVYGILFILSLIIEPARIGTVDYWQFFEQYPPITQFSLLYRIQLQLVDMFLFAVSIAFILLFDLKHAIISGIIGFFIYALKDISMLFVTTDLLIVRIIVLACYLGIQIYIIYVMINPSEVEILEIKRIIGEMSEDFTIATIKEVSEKTKSDHYLVSKILASLISEGKLDAVFFKRSKKVAFYHESV